VVALSQVCRAWREAFISRSSLWVDFHCMDADKTRVYLERSKGSPIDLWLDREGDLSPHDPLFQVVPHATGRLKNLSVEAAPATLHSIIPHLCDPAPFLEFLSIDGCHEFEPESNPVLTPALFNGDLSSLRVFYLQWVRTELPWRNMINLTSFMLCHASPADVSVRRLLDFFESAPRLRKIELNYATPISGPAQNGRLVTLACLKRMIIYGNKPSSLLLDHLLIPVGAKLTTMNDSRGLLIEDHLPRFLDNLRNLSNFTKINLRVDGSSSRMRFTGPNGQVSMNHMSLRTDTTPPMLEYLVRFDTSKAERLQIFRANPSSVFPLLHALLPMENLRSLTVYQCKNLYAFAHALRTTSGSSGILVCPKLEELVLVFPYDSGGDVDFVIERVIAMAAVRESRGMKLKLLRIAGLDELMPIEEWKLKKYVLQVECGPGVEIAQRDSDDSEEED